MASSQKNDKTAWYYKQAQERFVAMLISRETESDEIVLTQDKISSNDIEDPRLSIIYQAIIDLVSSRQKVSPYTIVEFLRESGRLSDVGGADRILELEQASEDYSLDGTLEDYAKVLKDFSIRRSTIEILKGEIENLKDDSGHQSLDVIAGLQGELAGKLLEYNTSESLVSLSSVAESYLERLSELASMPDDKRGIPTFLPTLDEITGGWKPGQLITVAAQTSIGKSVFGVNCATAAAVDKKSVLLFSLEMQEDEVSRRIISSLSGVPMNTLKTGKVNAEEKEEVSKALDSLKGTNFFVDAQLSTTLGAIKAKAKKQSQTAEGLDFMIVDYIGLIGSEGLKTRTEREQLEEITRELKLLAVELKIPIMVIAQLTRPSNSEEVDNLPTKYQIRGSGGIANDSDVIILIHRNRSTDGEVPYTKIIVDKNRDGENGRIITCHSNLACSIFVEVKREKDFEDDSESPSGKGSYLDMTEDDDEDFDLPTEGFFFKDEEAEQVEDEGDDNPFPSSNYGLDDDDEDEDNYEDDYEPSFNPMI